MPKFLNVPERRTCRYDSQNLSVAAEINGLYTDNFGMCNIIVLYQKNGDKAIKISMTHADLVVKPEEIQREIDWIRSPDSIFTFYIIRKNNEKSLFITKY